MKSTVTPALHRHFRVSWLYLAGAILLLYIVLPQAAAFRQALQAMGRVNIDWLILAFIFSLGAHIGATVKYQVLALKTLNFGPTLLVQLSSLLTNRLLPAGIGGIGTNYDYLLRRRHSKAEAAVVVSINNLLGLVGHGLLLLVLVLAYPARVSWHWRLTTGWLVIAGLVVLGICLVWLGWRRHLAAAVRQLTIALSSYSHRRLGLLAGVMGSIWIAACYAACLWASAQALGFGFDFTAALVVLTAGVAASAVTPTPGGLVGVEAALVAGLVAYGLTPASALVAALLYRLITYWFAMLLGLIALPFARRNRYV